METGVLASTKHDGGMESVAMPIVPTLYSVSSQMEVLKHVSGTVPDRL
jgi:hypothetical protein